MFGTVLRRSARCDALGVLTVILRSVATTLAHGEPDANSERALAQLKAQADELEGAAQCHQLLEPQAITAACEAALNALDRRQKARQGEMAVFLASVRESIASLTYVHDVSALAIGDEVIRLEHSSNTENVTDLKRIIADAALATRQAISDHERQHKEVLAALTQRLTLAEEQLSLSADEALIDPLTRASNRHGFDLAFEKRIKELDPETPLVLALFDIDGLRSINHGIGQTAGDAVLRHVAATLRQAVRSHDVVARIGGDEFAVLASGLTLGRAHGRMRQIIAAIRDGSVAPGGEPVSVSCGAAEFSAGDTMPTLLHRADAALREAKTHGNGGVATRTAPSIRSMLHPAKFRRGS